MKALITPTAKRNLPGTGRFFVTAMVAIALFGCQKEVVNPANTAAPVASQATVAALQLGDTKVNLLQGNENLKATTLRWTPAPNATYTVEAAPYGDNFADIVEIATTAQAGTDITVKDLNKAALLMVPAGTTGKIELRVRANNGKINCGYTEPVALEVTTYLPYTEYTLPNLMHVPGSYNAWKVATAPTIVNIHNDGVYEGFINFITDYTQFLVVKDISWNPLTTYYNIGNGKFGFDGNIFNNYVGAGAYQIKVNSNNNTWACVKINNWGLYGSAVKNETEADPQMTYDPKNLTWTINADLVPGNFRIRANNNDAVNFGKTMVNGYLVPDHNGADFTITNAGNYHIVLNLQLAGNYTCTVVKNAGN